MIDTIVITIPEESFSIFNHDKFSPSTINLFQAQYYRFGGRANFSCVQNPTKSELKKGVYKPRLTVTKRMVRGEFKIVLKIEFSIPKLLFGNNFDEVEESDFNRIIQQLHEKLKDMGVMISEKILINAPVSAVHLSKNILLADYSTPYSILKEISKINLNQKLDLNQTDFRNEGHCLKFRANSFEIVFYDKLKDLNKAKTSEKRAIERDYWIQLNLFDPSKPKKPFEVLRIEIRLNSRAKIRQIFKKLQIIDEITFSSIFKREISQKIHLFYFQQIENEYSLIAYKPKNIINFLLELKVSNPDIKLRKALQILGLKAAIDEMGIRELRETMKIFGKINWYRLNQDYKQFIHPSNFSFITKPIRKALTEFSPLKLSHFIRKPLEH